jgi:ribosome recycling factor
MLEKVYKETRNRMEKTIQAYHHELVSIRTGRASVSMLEPIKVEYYGSMMPINQISTVSIPEPRLIVITPWDKSVIDVICKAIMKSDLGLTPSTDGNIIRIPIPHLTEERRKEIVKMVKKKAEDARIAIRNIRRDENLAIKKAKDNKLITEDEERKGYEKIQKITDEYIEKIDNMTAEKEKEIMEG